MFKIVRSLLAIKVANPWLLVGGLVLASLVEGVGVAGLLPLLTVATGSANSDNSQFRLLTEAIASVGLSPDFRTLLGLVIGAMVLTAALNLLVMRYVGRSAADVATQLQTDLVRNVLRTRWSFYTAQPVGRVTNAVASEAGLVANAYKMTAVFLSIGAQTVAYVAVAFFLSWQLSLAAMLVGGAIVSSLGFLVTASRRAGLRRADRLRQIVVYLNDVLNNIKPLKAMAKQDTFQSYLERRLAKLRKALHQQVSSLEGLKYLQEILISLAAGVGFLLAYEVWLIPATRLIVMYVVIVKIVKNLAKLQRNYQRVANASAPFEAVSDFLDEMRRAEEPTHAGRAPSFEQSCRFDEVSFAFGEKPVLREASLEVPARSITVIAGASGAGKTTLIDLLLAFQDPDAGRILIDGVPLSELDWSAWRGMIGYVPQELDLFHDTILMNVTLGDPNVSEEDARRALEAAEAWDFVEELPHGILHQVGERGAQLSGGQRQRISLARALATRPKLLILDEVSSALDAATERAICTTLRGLTGELAVLAITHRPHFLEIADRIYELEEGRLERTDRAPHVSRVGLAQTTAL